MLSATEIAARIGVSKQAISRRVQRLVDQHGLNVARDGAGRIVAIDAAQFEALIGHVGDASKVPISATPVAQERAAMDAPGALPQAQPDSLDEARRQQAWINARRSDIELAKVRRELVRVDALAEAISVAGGHIAMIFDRLPSSADTLAAAMTDGGAAALRKALAELGRELRGDAAAALARVAEQASEEDEQPMAAQ